MRRMNEMSPQLVERPVQVELELAFACFDIHGDVDPSAVKLHTALLFSLVQTITFSDHSRIL